MTISERTETFFGKTVQDYEGGAVTGARASTGWSWTTTTTAAWWHCSTSTSRRSTSRSSLILGRWNEPHDDGPGSVLDHLAELAPQLPKLKALFVGDMTYEECEISWIIQGTRYSHLLQAFPQLEVLRIRGATSLAGQPLTHAGLRELVIESGGLPVGDREGAR